jgi:hypothetical protein
MSPKVEVRLENGRDSSRRATFVEDIAVDDLHPETIVRFARTTPRIDGNAPASIEGRRCYRMAFRARAESAHGSRTV